ncbi:MAG TPA: TIGR03118 family protein [Vicinamibacterales bacterium]|nr:TIGR03118 family protein [Vicinamibacterales bacterium]
MSAGPVLGPALAPPDFGPMSNALLITNNISRGRINAFDPSTGNFLGPLRDTRGQPIEIDDVWAIQFGQGGSNGEPNELFFTAGNNNYGSGTFGVIRLTQ